MERFPLSFELKDENGSVIEIAEDDFQGEWDILKVSKVLPSSRNKKEADGDEVL